MTAGQWWLPPGGPSVDPRTPGYQIDAHAFNAVTRVLGEAAEFVALSVRQRIARAVVAEVVPLAISEERKRIRQLAIDRDATAWNAPLDANECSRVDFADLIREQS